MSFGVMLYFISCGEFPFDDDQNNEKIIAYKILQNIVTFTNVKWVNRTKSLKNLIRACLEKEIDKRFTIDQILNHDFLTTDC